MRLGRDSDSFSRIFLISGLLNHTLIRTQTIYSCVVQSNCLILQIHLFISSCKLPKDAQLDYGQVNFQASPNMTLFSTKNVLTNFDVWQGANSLRASNLANRTQSVEFKNNPSKHTNINVGVPQGSIMGPLLFIVYINDIIFSSNIFKFNFYADDTTLFTTIKSPDENNSHTQLINNEL